MTNQLTLLDSYSGWLDSEVEGEGGERMAKDLGLWGDMVLKDLVYSDVIDSGGVVLSIIATL